MAERFAFSPETLIKAYSLGVFPMAESADSRDIRFYDPEIRALIPLSWREGARHEFHLPRRLARTVRKRPFTITIDHDFARVIDECAALKNGRQDTWINRDIRQLYVALHRLGFAHSIEVWQEDRSLSAASMGSRCGSPFSANPCSRAGQTPRKSRLCILWRAFAPAASGFWTRSSPTTTCSSSAFSRSPASSSSNASSLHWRPPPTC